LEDLIRIPPERFGEPIEKVIEDILKVGYDYKGRREGGYEGKLDKDLGVVLAITKIREIRDGTVIAGDGAAYHNTVFSTLVFKPDLHEILDGEVVEIVEFGAFVRFGPLDGLIHVSQITDDFIIHDKKRGALIGKESNKALEVGDKVRSRVVAVSMNPDKIKDSKINLTMRQVGLGKFEWIEESREKKQEKSDMKGKTKKGSEKEKSKGKEKGKGKKETKTKKDDKKDRKDKKEAEK